METTGQCHCGAIKFKATLRDGLDKVVRCNCSMCRMKGAAMAFVPLGGIELTVGADVLATYQFHSNTAKHHFCPRCGIHVYHQRRFDPTLHAVNVACLDGVSPYQFGEVPLLDGANHPRDTGESELKVIAKVKIEPLA